MRSVPAWILVLTLVQITLVAEVPAAGEAPAETLEVSINCDDHLRFCYAIDAITAVSGPAPGAVKRSEYGSPAG